MAVFFLMKESLSFERTVTKISAFWILFETEFGNLDKKSPQERSLSFD